MMLPPTQQASATLITSMVKSIVDDIEERRLAEEEKLKGERQADKVLKTRVTSDDVAGAANARINEHFFGALKRDENQMAKLIGRFTAAMGLTQEAGEINDDFANRLGDSLVIMDMILKYAIMTNPPEKVTLARFKVSAGEIAAINNGTADEPTDMALTLARFAKQNGLAQDANEPDKVFSERMGGALIAFRKTQPESIEAVEKKSGLDKLGISAQDMVEAIRNPYGAKADAIEAILDDSIADDKTLTVDIGKILQRLEDVADPKTIEELKADRLEKDPTKVEDAETRKEREESIRSLEAGEKLEDVQKLQDAVEKGNEAAAENGTAEGTATGENAGTVAIETIQILAAGAEIAEMQAAIEIAGNTQLSGSTNADTDDATEADGSPTDDEQAIMLARAGQSDAQTREDDAAKDILAVSVDDNGIYELLAQKKAA